MIQCIYLIKKKTIITSLLILFNIVLNGQVKNSSPLSKINTAEQAEEFIKKYPKSKVKLLVIESSKDTTKNILPIYHKPIGYIFRFKNTTSKILKKDSSLSFRVSYIYINGENFSKKDVDSIRQEIILKYNNGINFLDLVKQYNMDGNVTGDTNWFTENMMVKDFEIAVRNHKKGDIFIVDAPSYNWYHVVLKTYDDNYIKKITILQN